MSLKVTSTNTPDKSEVVGMTLVSPYSVCGGGIVTRDLLVKITGIVQHEVKSLDAWAIKALVCFSWEHTSAVGKNILIPSYDICVH